MVGKIGSGRSTLIDNIIGEDYLHIEKGLLSLPVTPQHVQRELLINNNKYQCNFIELPVFTHFTLRTRFLSRLPTQIKGNV